MKSRLSLEEGSNTSNARSHLHTCRRRREGGRGRERGRGRGEETLPLCSLTIDFSIYRENANTLLGSRMYVPRVLYGSCVKRSNRGLHLGSSKQQKYPIDDAC